MKLNTQTPEFFNDICEEIRLLYGNIDIELTDTPSADGLFIRHEFSKSDGYVSTACLFRDGALAGSYKACCPTVPATALEDKKYAKRTVKQSVFRLLRSVCDTPAPWGSLTGIRPTKLARELARQYGGDEAMRMFSCDFDVTDEKLRLAFGIVGRQQPVLQSIKQNDIDIYIGIPFCPSRCSYCSFASNDLAKAGRYVDEYLDRLIFELRDFAAVSRFDTRCIYIGGGTPTSLTAEQTERLLTAVDALYPQRREFTVEAGRPDTIDADKLAVLKAHGVSRISINPQTMVQQTLDAIGRRHTVEQITEAFALARSRGFNDINMDLIAGLPGESFAQMEETLRSVKALSPESITVHTLAIKRASAMAGIHNPAGDTESMVDCARDALTAAGYAPYYMYRQKYMSANLENVGYAKPGCECVYNIDIMEEAVSIAAFGAGAISKLVVPEENRIERSANVSDLANYLSRTEEMCARRRKLFMLT